MMSRRLERPATAAPWAKSGPRAPDGRGFGKCYRAQKSGVGRRSASCLHGMIGTGRSLKNHCKSTGWQPSGARCGALSRVWRAAGHTIGLTYLRAIATAIARKTARRNPVWRRLHSGASGCHSKVFQSWTRSPASDGRHRRRTGRYQAGHRPWRPSLRARICRPARLRGNLIARHDERAPGPGSGRKPACFENGTLEHDRVHRSTPPLRRTGRPVLRTATGPRS